MCIIVYLLYLLIILDKSYYQRPSYFNDGSRVSYKEIEKENKRKKENHKILMNHRIISPDELLNESVENNERFQPQYYISYKDKPSQEMMKELKTINMKENENRSINKVAIVENETEDSEMNEINSFLTPPPKYYSSYKLYKNIMIYL